MIVVSDARVLADHADYSAAKADVDTLSRRGFPVQHLAIVGAELYLQEWTASDRGRVLVRTTRAVGAALIGALFGAAMVALADAGVIAIFLGAAAGLLIGSLLGVHAVVGTFAGPCCPVTAGRHRVLVSPAWADDARLLLNRPNDAEPSAHREGKTRMSIDLHARAAGRGDRA